MKKRLLAFSMVLALLLSCLPGGVFAEGTVETEPQPQTDATGESLETAGMPEPHSHSEAQHDCEHCDGQVTWIAWGDDQAEKTTVPSGTGHYYLVDDISVSERTDVANSKDMVLCLNGYTIDAGHQDYIYRVGTNGSTTDKTKVTVSDCTAYTDEENVYHAGAMVNGTGKDGGGAFFLRGASSLTMYAGKLSGHKNTQTATDTGYGGGAIHARNTATILLKNVEISDNSSTKDGGAICARDSVQVTLENVVFKNNTSQRDGGAIFLNGSGNKLTATDCTFDTNKSTARGGAIMVQEGGSVTVSGGVFKNNEATTLGGAVYSTKSTVKVTGESAEKKAAFTDNTAKGSGGGGIYATGTNGSVELQYVEMTGNTSGGSGGSALFVTGNTMGTVADSTFTGNKITKVSTYRGAVYVAGKASGLTLSGKVVIKDNEVADLYVQNNSVRDNGDCWVNLDGLTEGSEIKLNTLNAVDVDELNSLILDGKPETLERGWIVYAATGEAIVYDQENDQFVFTVNTDHLHCDCGDGTDANCDHTENAYLPWPDGTSLPASGTYYLQTDVVLAENVPVSGELKLCLNGHSIRVEYPEQGSTKDRFFTMNANDQLTLSDCKAKTENGVYTAGKLSGSSYTAVMVANSSTTDNTVVINFYDGIFTGNESSAGAAFSIQDGATLNMYGGEISGNHSTRLGGAIYVGTNGTFHMYGGKITGNTADGNGTVYVDNSVLGLYGGEVSGNTAAAGAGIYVNRSPITLEGTPVITGNTAAGNASNLYLRGTTVITLGQLGAGQAKIGVGADQVPFTLIEDMGGTDCSGYFFSDSQYRMLQVEGSKLSLTASDDHKHCDCGSPEGEGCKHEAKVWAAWESTTSLPTSEGYYYLVGDVNLTNHAEFNAGDVHLCLNGFTVTADSEDVGKKGDRIFTIGKDAKLTVSDCTAKIVDGKYVAGSLTGGSAGAIMITNQNGQDAEGNNNVNNVVVNFYDGIITGNYVEGTGGVITVQDQAVFNMYSGEISGNQGKFAVDAEGKKSGGMGSAFYAGTNGIINLYGGTITGNICEDSGTIYVTGNSTLNLYGGKVTGNTVAKNGGGVLLNGTQTVMTMTGGEISGNTAGGSAGGVLLQVRASLDMQGGKVSGNSAGNSGGGIYVSTNSSMTMSGGVVTGNKAESDAGGVNVFGAVFTMTGGEISGNTAANGAGLTMRLGSRTVDGKTVRDVPATVTMQGGKVSGNKATTTGGGVLVNGEGAVFTMEGGEISKNEAPNGGGVITQTNAVFNLKSGKVTGNTAPKGGAGIYVSYTSTLNMEGGEISGNSAQGNGGGIYDLGAVLNLKGGKISGNYAKGTGGAIYANKYTRYSGKPNEITYTSEINVQGVVISGNTTPGNGAGICTSKNTVVNMTSGSITGNVSEKAAGGMLLQSGSKLNLSGGTISNNKAKSGAGVYISTDSFITMTGGSISNNTSTGNGAGLYLLRCEATLSGGTISNNTAESGGGGAYMAGANVKLCGTSIKDNTAKGNGGGIMTSRQRVTDKATGEQTEYLTTITMTAGTVSGNQTEGSGGGILLQSKTTMTFKDGVIEKNHTGKDGGGIYVSTDCTFYMEGGEIRYNIADRNGAGLYNLKSTNTYTGGSVHHNTAGGNGGGIVMSGEGYVNTMTGGITITENTSVNGGAIVVQGRVTLNMENVDLTNNSATTGNGGAIYLSTNSFLNITGGSIQNHSSGGYGGAIFTTTNSFLTMKDTKIQNNKAGYGGGFSLGGTTDIQNVTISGNEATEEGGGIYVHKMLVGSPGENHVAVIKDSVIENNKAGKQGGGLFLRRGSRSELDGLTVQNNTAAGEGGGLYIIDDTSMYNMTVTGNTSGGEGYAVYMAPSEFDGSSYFIGIFKIGGVMKIDGNTGGDMYIGEQTTVAVDHMGLTGDTLMNIKLHSGYLTNTLYGEYNYEGGNQEYVVTAGDRSLTDPEYDAAYNDLFKTEEPVEDPSDATEPVEGNENQGGNSVVYIVIGAFVVVIAAVLAILLAAKKKKSGAKAEKATKE